MAKAAASDAATEVGRAAVQVHGGLGITVEADVSLFYLRARQASMQLGGRDANHLTAALAGARLDRVEQVEPFGGDPLGERGVGRGAAEGPAQGALQVAVDHGHVVLLAEPDRAEHLVGVGEDRLGRFDRRQSQAPRRRPS